MEYYFSSNMSRGTIELLSTMPGFSPINTLVSQLDRTSISNMIEYKKEGYVDKIFIDSGAYSVHSGRAKVNVDEYIAFLNSIDEYINVCAPLDTIPGTFRKPKKPSDYLESAEKTWENYLYMYPKLKSPNKLTAMYHQGEPWEALHRILDYRHADGSMIDYCGTSPANDVAQSLREQFLYTCFDIIHKSSNPNIKTHLYGMTSWPTLQRMPAYSADSVSHIHSAGTGNILLPKYGIVYVSNRTTSAYSKSKITIQCTMDKETLTDIDNYLQSIGSSLEQCATSVDHRMAVTMHTIILRVRELNKTGHKPKLNTKKLFNI